MTLGIIDVGTNSIHLLIGILGLTGKFHVILKERDLTRLGEGGLVADRLAAPAIHRAMEVLSRYAGIMKRCGVDRIEAVATSAVRGSANGRAFVSRVRRKLGIPLRIITGREEARLIYLGVLQTQRFAGEVLLVTIGGGSAQVVVADATRLRYAESVPLGGARLAQRFIRHDPARLEELERLDAHLRARWAPVARQVRRHRWGQAFGSSATINQLLLAAHLRRRHRATPQPKDRLAITRRELERLVDWLSRSRASERIQLPGLDPRREDLALPTGMVLLSWMEQCGVTRLRYAPGSVREGLVIDYLIRHHQRRAAHPIEDPLKELFSTNGAGELSLPRPMVSTRKAVARRLLRHAKRTR